MNTTTRNALADEFMDGCPEECLEDHEIIADAIRRGESVKTILSMPETDRWPDTYIWLRDRLV